jgi:transcription elongation GreA/GreB family factor
VRAALLHELSALQAAAADSHAGATHEENRPEHGKDMRAVEASYLARGQAERVNELSQGAAALDALRLREFGDDDPIALSALVTVEVEDQPQWFFVAPAAGGVRVEFHGRAVQVVTPRSPLGAALVGKRVGDVAEVKTQQGVREYEIVAIE